MGIPKVCITSTWEDRSHRRWGNFANAMTDADLGFVKSEGGVVVNLLGMPFHEAGFLGQIKGAGREWFAMPPRLG